MRNGAALFLRAPECVRGGMITRTGAGAERPSVQVRFGRRVRELRGMRRLSQAALADAAGLSYKFVGEIERGIGNPTLKTISSLAAALECEMGELLAKDDASPAASVTPADAARLEHAIRILQSVLTPKPRRRRGRP